MMSMIEQVTAIVLNAFAFLLEDDLQLMTWPATTIYLNRLPSNQIQMEKNSF